MGGVEDEGEEGGGGEEEEGVLSSLLLLVLVVLVVRSLGGGGGSGLETMVRWCGRFMLVCGRRDWLARRTRGSVPSRGGGGAEEYNCACVW